MPEDETPPAASRGFLDGARLIFLQGLVLVVPLVVTFWVFRFLWNTLDGLLKPAYHRLLGQDIPGLGLITVLVFIFLIGLLTRNLVGKMILSGVESLLRSIPVIKIIYMGAKELMDAFSGAGGKTIFREVLLVEFPRLGCWSVGFVTNRVRCVRADGTEQELVKVYVPHAPNPTSGLLLLLSPDQVRPLQLSVEEGLKLVVSGGIVAPPVLVERPLNGPAVGEKAQYPPE